MSISEEINKSYYSNQKAANVNKNTIESVANELFKVGSNALIYNAKNGYVKTYSGWFSTKKYVEFWIEADVDKSITSGHPAKRYYDGEFSHWSFHDTIDINRTLAILKSLCSPEGIKVNYSKAESFYPSRFYFYCDIKQKYLKTEILYSLTAMWGFYYRYYERCMNALRNHTIVIVVLVVELKTETIKSANK